MKVENNSKCPALALQLCVRVPAVRTYIRRCTSFHSIGRFILLVWRLDCRCDDKPSMKHLDDFIWLQLREGMTYFGERLFPKNRVRREDASRDELSLHKTIKILLQHAEKWMQQVCCCSYSQRNAEGVQLDRVCLKSAGAGRQVHL